MRIADILTTASGTYRGDSAGQIFILLFVLIQWSPAACAMGVSAGFQFSAFEDAGMIDKVETIKGPAGFITCNRDPGSLVNMVTKQPATQRIFDVTAGYGSFNMMRSTIKN